MFKKILLIALLLSVQASLVPQQVIAQSEHQTTDASRSPESVIKAAKSTKATLDAWQHRVVAQQDELNSILDQLNLNQLDLSQLETESLAKDKMSDLLELLDDEAKSLETVFESIGPDLMHYRKAIDAAPKTYSDYATQLDEFATGERDPVMQGLYADFASSARKLSKHYVERGKDVDELADKIEEHMKTVASSRLFITRIQKFISIIPDDYGPASEQFAKRLDHYVKTFREAATTVRSVSDRLAAPSKTKGTKSNRAVPAKSQASSRTLQIDGMLKSLTTASKRN